ncbi:integral membrane protein [Streptomyces zinciresistens K42]|uniref:Integral membrane protein n=1 Tax=Streptomyces zinciresistens K42 TaxID=700597 RepID=G2GBK7_9ACTN|nr:streptophobe family protein [Streptomyces zinciresistens]EGX59123.1 integral membrane protein [Streptomyces zinciresistens K42]
MSASAQAGSTGRPARLPWGDVLLSAVAAVSWALIAMAGTAALGLHLLAADASGSLGAMTAAVVALAAGGSVTPAGDVSAFGLTGAQAATALDITPLGVGLAGAVLLSWCFLRSLRRAGAVIAPAELLARAGAVVVLFVATLGGLAWAGHDVITLDGSALGLDRLPGTGGGGGGLEIPGIGDAGGLLPDRLGGLVDAKAAVGFSVETAPTLLGGLVWSCGVLLIALLAARRSPLPTGLRAVHRVVRPAVSALVAVLLVAVAAGLAAAGYAAIGDDDPGRVAGAALLGAPNGVWLGVPLGLLVPFDGRASGVLAGLLPDPLGALLAGGADRSVTLGRLAEPDGRVWLLGVAAALMMLLAGVLTAVRTPVGTSEDVREPAGVLRFTGRCALRLGAATALALPLLALLTGLSVDASLSVLGFDAFGAGVELRGNPGMALVLGAVWGAGAGAVGASAALATGAAGGHAAPLALAGGPRDLAGGPRDLASGPGGRPGAMGGGGASNTGGGGGRGVGGARDGGGGASTSAGDGGGGGSGGGVAGAAGAAGAVGAAGVGGPVGAAGVGGWAGQGGAAGYAGSGRDGPGSRAGHDGPLTGRPLGGPTGGPDRSGPMPGHPSVGTPDAPGRRPGPPDRNPGTEQGDTPSGPYTPTAPYRPPNPATNPYLRLPEQPRGDARPSAGSADPGSPQGADRAGGARASGGARPPGGDAAWASGPPSAERSPTGEPPPGEPPPCGDGDVHGAPTVRRPAAPPPGVPRRGGDGPARGSGRASGDVPPPPPPVPPRNPKRRP